MCQLIEAWGEHERQRAMRRCGRSGVVLRERWPKRGCVPILRPHSASLTCAPRAIYAQCIEALWQCYREQPNKVQFVQVLIDRVGLMPSTAENNVANYLEQWNAVA